MFFFGPFCGRQSICVLILSHRFKAVWSFDGIRSTFVTQDVSTALATVIVLRTSPWHIDQIEKRKLIGKCNTSVTQP